MKLRFNAHSLLLITLVSVLGAARISIGEETPAGTSPPPVEAFSVPSPAHVEVDVEFDAYYTNAGFFIPLSGQSMSDLGERDEVEVYKELLRNLARPRFVLVEAAVFPMPLLGTYLKKNHSGFYNDAGNGKFNIIESITAGFQEPYALSFFFGDIVRFTKKGEQSKDCNKGYMGIMLSYAPRHIKNNVLLDDNSFEVEWKLKGDRIFKDEDLSWSFRLGTKIHDHPEIANTGYLGMRRSNVDFNSHFLSWLKNSSFELKWDVALRDGQLLRQEYVLGKRFPLKNLHMALTLDVGLIWESSRLYSGPLSSPDFHNYVLVFRPNLKF